MGRPPHPKFGTIELRILDSQTSLKAVSALTALTQCIVARSLEDNVSNDPYDRDIAEENKWRAARHGMDATFYDATERVSFPAKDMARALVEELKPRAQDLGCENELLDVLELVADGTGSNHQREIYEQDGDFLDVVAFLIEGTRPALAEEPS